MTGTIVGTASTTATAATNVAGSVLGTATCDLQSLITLFIEDRMADAIVGTTTAPAPTNVTRSIISTAAPACDNIG